MPAGCTVCFPAASTSDEDRGCLWRWVWQKRAVLAYYFHDLSPFIVRLPNGMGLHWYGLAYVLSFVLGGWLYRWLAEHKYTDLPAAQVSDFICWAAVFGVMIGGRLGWILFYGLEQSHTGDPWYWPIEVWKGGMASHGGIIGLVLFTLYWSKTHRVSWTSIGDSLVVVAPVGLFLVRMANFINGELFGKPATVPWAVQFPKELVEAPTTQLLDQAHDALLPFQDLIQFDNTWPDQVIDAIPKHPELIGPLRQVLTPRHPSQIYEALLEGVVLFSVLWILRTRCRVPRGVLTGAFFILYAVLRIIGELFRVPDPAWHVGSISAGQFLSIFLVFIGTAFIAWGYRTKEYERAWQPPEG
ncbi:MAG: prolipoprotein diacylglyceryl transferase [Chthoniobacter sp.]|nr:prolipoprotein diacylglyceryl transferase [Chthoniobacter sp.]